MFLSQFGVELLDYPAHRSELHPMQHLWDELAHSYNISDSALKNMETKSNVAI